MKTILLVSHMSNRPGGPLDKFYSFLKKNYNIYRILYPISPKKNGKSVISDNKRFFSFTIAPALQYPLEGFYTLIIWFRHFRTAPKVDLAICFDSLSYFHIFLIKKFLRIDKIAYYNVDYSKKRFSNFFMNTVYKLITKFSYITCDYFFSFNNAFTQGVDPKSRYTYKHTIVKSTVDLKSIKRGAKKIPRSLVYAGTVAYATIDFEPVLKALKRLKNEKVAFRLYIYCNIDDTNSLTTQITLYGLENTIVFCGTIENHILVQKLLPKYTIGIAAYANKRTSEIPDFIFRNNDLMGKLVDYIAAGLPIISTRINDSFRMIDENKIGFSVVTAEEWYKAIKTLLYNKALYRKYSKNALLFAKNYDANSILTPLFQSIL